MNFIKSSSIFYKKCNGQGLAMNTLDYYRFALKHFFEYADKECMHVWHNYVEQVEELRYTPRGKELYYRRQETIERVFADGKEKHGMRYTLYKGLDRVNKWLSLKFAAMNLKKMALRMA